MENKLSLQEINFKKIHEEMERQLENVHAEAAKNRSYLEAEIIKWKVGFYYCLFLKVSV